VDKNSEVRNSSLIKYAYIGLKRVAQKIDVPSGFSVESPRFNYQPSVYFLHDHLGSTAITLDRESVLGEQMVNYPYGHSRVAHQLAYSNLKTYYHFSGKENDVESRLYYFEMRYLAFNVARFISTDHWAINLDVDSDTIKGFPQRLNAYCYVKNNPIVLIDKDGKKDESIIIVSKGDYKVIAEYNKDINLFSGLSKIPVIGFIGTMIEMGIKSDMLFYLERKNLVSPEQSLKMTRNYFKESVTRSIMDVIGFNSFAAMLKFGYDVGEIPISSSPSEEEIKILGYSIMPDNNSVQGSIQSFYVNGKMTSEVNIPIVSVKPSE
jgi:RHS repeat-associated protein